jgi:hypothetical protein
MIKLVSVLPNKFHRKVALDRTYAALQFVQSTIIMIMNDGDNEDYDEDYDDDDDDMMMVVMIVMMLLKKVH